MDPLFVQAQVLVAEDNSTNQMVLMALLRAYGIQAELVANGEQAVAACRRRKFDLILMDCQMPVMDGWEATMAIRAEHPQAPPVVAVTANTDPQDQEKCIAVGMEHVLAKPIQRAELVAVLRRFLKADAA